MRQSYTDKARSGSADELTNLAFFNLIIDNDLENGGDLLKDAAKRHPSAQTLCQYARFLYNVKKELWNRGGAEALRMSLDETYHPDEICPAVREDMAAEAKFMEEGKTRMEEKARKAAEAGMLDAQSG